ncbi:hypothetical protein ASG53_03180 [Sanguibacter sp. Leaf3]|nr:hypothetical protein ASG53_03180 [Sanguibacter sp. Leaf3]
MLLGLVVLGGGAVAGYLAWVNNNIERIADPFDDLDPAARPTPAPTEPGAEATPLNILVLGSDSRISAGDPSSWEEGGQRTDALMIVHLPADRKSAVVMSIPRDSWVPVPGHGEAKINAAFSFGGPTLAIQTVEDLTGIRIDNFVVADFTSFVELTDTLGGVQITVPEDVYEHDTLLFSAGKQTLSGEQALAYTRQRYGLPGGDFDRVKRQQNWIRAMVAKTKNDGLISNPVRLTNLLTVVSRSVSVDDSLGINEMRAIAESLDGLATNDITFLTAPDAGTGTSADGQSIVLLDRAAFDPLVAAIAQDTSAEYIEANKDALGILGATVK